MLLTNYDEVALVLLGLFLTDLFFSHGPFCQIGPGWKITQPGPMPGRRRKMKNNTVWDWGGLTLNTG